jgi:hypothetical protein
MIGHVGCWDCGSTVPDHHTRLCQFGTPDTINDLPAAGRSQYWVESGVGRQFAAGVDCRFHRSWASW